MAGARQGAFRASLECLRRIVAELPANEAEPDARVIRSMFLGPLGEALVELGDLSAADSMASEALDQLDGMEAWARGNLHYQMNEVRGRVALRRDQRAGAISFLQRAGRTEGSPQLSSFGPRFVLARELLEVGERDAVLEFLGAVGEFWRGTDAAASLDAARRIIEAGGIPSDVRWR